MEKDTRRASIDSFISARKKDSKMIVKDVGEYPVFARVKTGIYKLDYALGGGIPVGRCLMFFGDESSCKTTTAARVCGRFQRVCTKCYTEYNEEMPEIEWDDDEKLIPVDYSKLDRKIITKCNCGECREAFILYADYEGTFHYVKWLS